MRNKKRELGQESNIPDWMVADPHVLFRLGALLLEFVYLPFSQNPEIDLPLGIWIAIGYPALYTKDKYIPAAVTALLYALRVSLMGSEGVDKYFTPLFITQAIIFGGAVFVKMINEYIEKGNHG